MNLQTFRRNISNSKIQSENQQLKNELKSVQNEYSIAANNTYLEKKLQSLNLTTPEDVKRLKDVLALEIEQVIKDSERNIMVNVSTAIKELQLRDRYLSLSLLDAHNNTATLKTSLERQKNTTKSDIQNSSLSLHTEITKLNDALSKLQSTCTYNFLTGYLFLGSVSKDIPWF
jgi:hypothetical protein